MSCVHRRDTKYISNIEDLYTERKKGRERAHKHLTFKESVRWLRPFLSIKQTWSEMDLRPTCTSYLLQCRTKIKSPSSHTTAEM